MKRFVRLVLISTSLLLMQRVAPAQTTTGSIVGSVTDTTGGVVNNANVTVTNANTGLAVKTTTDSSGNYAVTTLPVGSYTVAVEAPGFKRAVNTGITVNVQDRIGVNIALE